MQPVLSADHFHSEEAAYAYVEERLWPDGPTCPHCGAKFPLPLKFCGACGKAMA